MDASLPSAVTFLHQDTLTGGSGATRALSRHDRLRSFLAVVVVSLPVLWCALLVKSHVVNAPHYDDFTFTDDWLRYKTGELHWSDLFSVHLEHRVTVPRLLALGLHILGGSDMRWQNGLTLLLLCGTWLNLLALWRRTTGCTIRATWIPLLAMSSIIFCAVQWQPLLWPILFEIFVGIWAFTLALKLWSGRMNPWLALASSVLLCVAAMLSFANGPLTWLLVPFAIWFQRNDLAASLRKRLIGVWLGCLVVTMLLYFHNFHNSAPPQFAYHLGETMTAEDTIESSLSRFATLEGATKAVLFFFAVLGSHLSRGLNTNNLIASQWIGGISFGLFLALFAWLVGKRKDASLLRSAAPWVLLGLYSIGTAALITIGRVWLTKSGIIALLPRYNSHAVALTVSLIALLWIMGGRSVAHRPWLVTAGALAAGAFLCLTWVEWVYGIRQMDNWRNARLANRALLMFSQVMPDKGFLGPVSGDGLYGAQIMAGLDRVHQSPVRLLKDLRLGNFHVSSLHLRHRQAGFSELRLTASGGLFAVGFAELPEQRPADLVIFTAPDADGTEQIFGITSLRGLPNYLRATTYKDFEGANMVDINPTIYARWEGTISLTRKPPPGATIKAYALDVEKNYAYLIPDNRQSQHPLPPLPPPPVD